jgi:hypothetical protein
MLPLLYYLTKVRSGKRLCLSANGHPLYFCLLTICRVSYPLCASRKEKVINHVLILQAIGAAMMLCKSPVQGTETPHLEQQAQPYLSELPKQPGTESVLKQRDLTQGR